MSEIMSAFSNVPMWLIFFFSIALILLCIEVGYRWGKYKLGKQQGDAGTSISTMVQIQLGLVAFLVAFTFGFVAQRFCERRNFIIDEANAIGTTYLRADFLPETSANTVKEVLRKYVDLRLKLTRDVRQHFDDRLVEDALAESNKLQTQLWNHTKLAASTHDSPCVAQFVSTVNDTIDLQSKRVYAERYGRLPDIIWVVLYGLTFLGMIGAGYQFGNAGARNWIAATLFAVSFSIVLTMIADIDRPQQGFISVSQQPLIDLVKQIGKPTSQSVDTAQ